MYTILAPRAFVVMDTAITGPVHARAARKLRLVAALAVVLALVNPATGFPQPAPQGASADVFAITQAVDDWFASQPGYQPGDLIDRSQVETVLAKLADAGIHVPDAKAMVGRALANDSFLVHELTTPAGRKFMRRLVHTQGSFSYLDRLSKIPRGEKLVRDLIRDKRGEQLVEYLATTKGGHKMGSMMAATPGGRDLNEPTGKIYTVADFEEALRRALVKKSP